MEKDNQDTEGPGGHEECAPDPASSGWNKVRRFTAGMGT